MRRCRVSAVTGWWRCADCGELTADPHTAEDDSDTCPACCEPCASGLTLALQDQYVKEHSTYIHPGDPMLYHGIPSREQMAAAEQGRP